MVVIMNAETTQEAQPEYLSEQTGNRAFTLSMDALIRRAATAMLVIVVLASALMSWEGLVSLGRIAGMGWTAFLLPLAIDGCLLLGSLESLHAVLGKRSSSFGGVLTLVGVSLSIAGNVVSAGHLGWLPASIHAIPPTMLFLSLTAFERIVNHRILVKHAEEKAVQRKKKRKTAVRGESAQPLRGQTHAKKAVLEEGVSVECLQEVLSDMDSEASKASKVEAMLSRFPEARTGLVAEALGVESRSVATTISRVRKKLAEKPVLSAVS